MSGMWNKIGAQQKGSEPAKLHVWILQVHLWPQPPIVGHQQTWQGPHTIGGISYLPIVFRPVLLRARRLHTQWNWIVWSSPGFWPFWRRRVLWRIVLAPIYRGRELLSAFRFDPYLSA